MKDGSSRIFVYGGVAGFFLGTAIGILYGSALSLSAFSILLACALCALGFFVRERALVGFLVILLCCVSFGIARTHLFVSAPSEVLGARVDSHVRLEGVVRDEPDRRESTDRITLSTEYGRVLVIAEPYPQIQYGDHLFAEGLLTRPEDFETDTGRVFAYEAYLGKSDIYFILERARVEIVGHGEGNPLQTFLYVAKNTFLKKIQSVIPEPESALLGGLLLGSKQSLGKELLEDFRIAGVIHVVVLSGFNMTIIAAAVMYVARRFLSFRIALIVGAVSVALFACTVGLSATVVRAGVMAEIGLLALFTGRKYDLVRALMIAGVGMVLISPDVLLYDPSFQLSFLATLALILVPPMLERWVKWLTTAGGVREIVTATLATQLFLLPFILWMTGTVSLVALPANLLILPTIPLTMLIGFLAGVSAFISPLIALPFAYSANLLLSYEIGTATFFAELPYAAFSIPPFSFWYVGITYGVFFVAWYILIRKDFTREVL